MTFRGRVEELLEGRARAEASAFPRDVERGHGERALHLAEALANNDRLRALLEDALADRDRGFENVLARLPDAPAAYLPANSAEETLAERTLNLAEALHAAIERSAVFEEGLSDRDRSFDVLQARWRELLRAETLRHAEREDELRADANDEILRVNALLEERTLQLAAALVAADATRAVMVEVLRANGDAFGYLQARLEAARRAAIPPPTVVRRVLRRVKRALPAPIVRVMRRG